MAQTQAKRTTRSDKDIITRLADAGEEAIARLAELPGGHRVTEAVQLLRDRLDDLQVRLRSLDPLERRVAELEKRLAALESKQRTPARRSPTRAKQ
jgi:hypothetical protein